MGPKKRNNYEEDISERLEALEKELKKNSLIALLNIQGNGVCA